jgi:hypothetical protein
MPPAREALPANRSVERLHRTLLRDWPYGSLSSGGGQQIRVLDSSLSRTDEDWAHTTFTRVKRINNRSHKSI